MCLADPECNFSDPEKIIFVYKVFAFKIFENNLQYYIGQQDHLYVTKHI